MIPQQLFVGREAELARLEGHLARARQGQGAVCFVSGEAGSGKSMLVREFVRRAQRDHSDVLVALGDCNAQTGEGHPYLPFREILTQLTGDVDEVGSTGAVTEEGARRLRDFGHVSREIITDIGVDLIGVIIPGASVIARLGARLFGSSTTPREEGRSEALVEQYTRVVKRLAGHRTLVLVMDDLHWADGPSIELLFHVARRANDSRVLLLGTFRPAEVALGRGDERHPLEAVLSELKRYFGDTQVSLDKTDASASRRFIDALVDREPNAIGAAFRTSLLKHTEGHPLFTVELLRTFQEQGVLTLRDGRWSLTTAPKWEQLPSRVEGVIEQKIGRLDEGLQEILRVASVMGETFALEVVVAVLRADRRSVLDRITRELERRHGLLNAHGVQRLGGRQLSQYRFRHNLFQTYLYHQLGSVERSDLHNEVGQALEEICGERSDEFAVELARHFGIAGNHARAVPHFKRAGDDAQRVFAYPEARSYYQSTLDALDWLEDNDENRGLRVAATVELVRSTYVSDPPEVNMRRLEGIEPVAAALPDPKGGDGGDVQLLAWVHYWMGRLEFQLNAPAKAIGYYQKVLAVADQLDDDELITIPSSMIGRAYVSQGRLAEAEPLLRQAIDPLEADGNIAEWIMTTGYLGMSIAGRGAFEEGLAAGERGLARAREVDSHRGAGLSHVYLWYIHLMAGSVRGMYESAEAAVEIARDVGDHLTQYVGLGMLAWAACRRGEPEEADRLMEECQVLADTLGDRLVVADWWAAARAEIELALGRYEQAAERAREAAALARSLGGVFAEGFAERAWAHALLASGAHDPEEVDSHFEASVAAFEKGQILPEIARSRLAWAKALKARGDRHGALQQLSAAEKTFDEMGLDIESEEAQLITSVT